MPLRDELKDTEEWCTLYASVRLFFIWEMSICGFGCTGDSGITWMLTVSDHVPDLLLWFHYKPEATKVSEKSEVKS